MRRLYLALSLLFSVVTLAFADAVTSLDELSNNKAYVISAYDSSRGFWYYNPNDPNTLYSTAVAGVGGDNTDTNKQFAILRSTRRGLLYFYSIGGKKFLNGPGDSYVYLTDTPSSRDNGLISSSSSKKSSHPWVCVDGDHQFNLSSDQYTGVLSSWNDINDGGNAVSIESVADFDPTEALEKIDTYEQSFCKVNIHYTEVYGEKVLKEYDQVKYVNMGESMTFDAPGYFFALKSADPTKESVVITGDQDISVTYNYEINTEEMPFETVKIEDGTYPANTPWYYVSVLSKDKYLTLEDDGMNLKTEQLNEHPVKSACLFSFDGNPIDGFYIMNKVHECAWDGICADEGDEGAAILNDTPINFFLEHNNEGYQFNLGTDTDRSAYLSTDYDGNFQTYDLGVAGRDNALTTFYFTKVPDSELEMIRNGIEPLRIDSITPAEGTYIGKLGSIRIHYWNYIKEIKKESDANYVKVYNSKTGELIDKVFATVDPDDDAVLLVNFTDSLKGGTTYTIVIPENTIYGDDGELALGQTCTYKVMGALNPGIVTARIWGTRIGDRIEDTPIQEMLGTYSADNNDYPIAKHPVWDMINYGSKGYITTKIDVKSENEVYIYGFTGVKDEDIDIKYDSDSEWGDFQSINGVSAGSYKYWTEPSSLTPDNTENQGYIWIYADTYGGGCVGHCWPDLGYGFINLSIYDWEEDKYASIYIDYYLDDRYNTGEKEAPTASFAQAEVSMKQRDVITNELTTNSDGSVTYTSGNEAVATVDDKGTVTATGVGTAVITASIAETDSYASSEVSYTVNVLENAELNAQLKELIASAKEMYTDEELETVESHAGTSIEKALLNLGDAVATASAITNAFQEDIDALTSAIDGYKGSVPDGTSYTIRGVIPSYVVNQINADTRVYSIRLTGATKIFGNLVLRDGCSLTTSEDGVEATTLSYAVSDDSEWGTICLPFELKSDDNIQYYELGGTQTSGSNVMYFDPVSSVAAHQPALYHKTGTAVTLTSEEGVTLNTTVSGTMASIDNLKFTGTYKEQSITSGYYYSDGSFLNAAGSSATILPYHAFFTLQDASAGPTAGSFTIAINTPTGILSLTTDLSGKTIYSAAGVKLSKPAKGINIIDGRKVMVK